MTEACQQRRSLIAALSLLAVVCCASFSFAHQVPRSEYDRNLTVKISQTGVQIHYRLELDEFTLLRDVSNPANKFPIDSKGKLGRKNISDAYLARMKEIIPDQIIGTIDGKIVPFVCSSFKVEFTDSAQFHFTLKSKIELTTGSHAIEIEDWNFVEKKGRLSIKIDVEDPLVAESVSEIAERRLTGVDNGKQGVKAQVRLEGMASITPAPATPTEPNVDSVPEQTRGFWELLRSAQNAESLAVLFDSDVGLMALLALAFLHGVLHSIAPGHGKTMVAAYLVGEQGTPKHAIALGLIVTMTHTSAAFAVALLLRFVLTDTPPETVQRILGFGGGLLVALIGIWLLVQRLAGRTDHAHAFGSHGHGHAHAHAHSHADGEPHSHAQGNAHSHGVTPDQFARLGWFRLVLLGISGGIIPCWGAILWVLYCVTAGRYGLGVSTVLSFSVGLASVLILIGLLVVWGGRAGANRYGDRKAFRYLVRWLSIVGAALVVVIGIWLCRANLPR